MSFIIPKQSKAFSKNQIRRSIHRLYDLVDKETHGLAEIERDPLRKRYTLHENKINVYFPENVKIRKIIHEVINQLGLERTTGNKTPYEGIGDMILGYSNDSPNVIVQYKGYDNVIEQHVYEFSFQDTVLLEKV